MAQSTQIHIRFIDILQKKTIANLAKSLGSANVPARNYKKIADSAPQLSPIQRLYLHLQPDPNICFDQYFFLKMHQQISSAAMEGPEAAACHIRECRKRLDIQEGPLLSAVLFDGAGTDAQRLFLTVHHFVVDLVSWRVMLRELEELLTVGTPTVPRSMSFNSWVALQAQYASEKLDPPQIFDTAISSSFAYWGMQDSDNLERHVISYRHALDESASALVLRTCNEIGVRPVDMMISALLHSFGLIFTDRMLPAIFSEGHGREPWDDGIDISTTVGWFTTLWPVRVPDGTRTALEHFGLTRECMQGLQKNGWSWFTSRFVNKKIAEALPSEFPAEILFNYEGMYQQLERSDGLFEQIDLPDGCAPESSGEIRRFALFEISTRVERGEIVTVWNHHRDMKHREKILKWTVKFAEVVVELAKEVAAARPEWLNGTTTDPATGEQHQDMNISKTEDLVVEQSFAQERLWFLEQLYPGMSWFLMPFAVRIQGPLQVDALEAAFLALEARHETLRTTFESADGVNVQKVHDTRPQKKAVNRINVASLEEENFARELQKDQTKPFHLETEPGWRVTVFQRQKDEYILSIVIHHIIYDGWSLDILSRELNALYSCALHGGDPTMKLTPLPIQYRDYSAWEKQQSQSEEQERQLDYWVQQLRTSQPAELLCDKPRPESLSGKADVQELRIEGKLYDRLEQLCQEKEMTPFVVLLAVFRATHYRLTGARDAAIGVANANRHRWELKDMIGFFINLQCIRIQTGDHSLEELISQVNNLMLDSFANQDVPFDRIVSKLKLERHLSRHPLVQMVFAVHSQRDFGDFTFEGVETKQIAWPVTSRFDLEFHFYAEQRAFRGEVLFSTELYEPETIQNMLFVFHRLLEQGLEDPTAAITRLPLMRANEYASLRRMGLVDISRTEYPQECSIVDVFCQQVASNPDGIAVKDSSEKLTYKALDRRSDLLASWLRRRGFEAETLIPVLANRCCSTIVAFLGILKANMAYLPLDTRAPSMRTVQVLSCTPGNGKKLILVGSDVKFPDGIRNCQFTRIADALEEEIQREDAVSPWCKPSPDSLAYVMFTSGSTGQPKGVMIEHRSILRLVLQSTNVEHLPVRPIMAHMANIAFDMSTTEIFASLLNGGTLICITMQNSLDYQALTEVFLREKVQALIITPTLLRQYLSGCPAALRNLRLLQVGGEEVDLGELLLAQKLMKGVIQNAYGPTENTGASTIYTFSERDATRVPIGRAVSNSGAYVMDERQNLVPLGVVGELVVTGDGLARGYANPAQNVGRFVTVTINGEMTRAYRTGDCARYRISDGQIEFLGRMDGGQVKIRGQRVELGEIDHVLRSQHSSCITDAVTLILGQASEDEKEELVSFVTIRKEKEIESWDETEEASRDQVNTWMNRFNGDAYSQISRMSPEEIGRDFVGWTSMITGGVIDRSDMNEWLDDTIETILNGGTAGRVLEIGTGSGMILFNLLTRGLTSYVGLEPSKRAAEFVTKTVESFPELANKVKMYQVTAAEVDTLGSISASLVVLNSVIQYFPSQKYLFSLIRKIVHLDGVTTIVLGDVRSFALYREFLAAKALHIAGEGTQMEDMRRIMDHLEGAESELLVDPTFFTSLAEYLPDQIDHVEILPKRMKATNELSQFRYSAVLHVKARERARQSVCDICETEWIDFMDQRLDGDGLEEILACASDRVAVSNIPSTGINFERHLVDELGAESQGQMSWLATARHKSQRCFSLSPRELTRLAEQTGYQVEISWARQFSQRGGFDAIFHKIPMGTHAEARRRTLFRFPTEQPQQPPRLISSEPLGKQTVNKAESDLVSLLAEQLPSYMVPQRIIVLDRLPVNGNGKIDHKALAQAARTRPKRLTRLARQPTSDVGLAMQTVWGKVLSMVPQSIGLDDNFFQLGGNSILAMKVIAEALKAGVTLIVADMFRWPVLGDLSKHCHFRDHDRASPDVYAPFCLLGKGHNLEDMAAQCSVDVSCLQDAYPCLPIQEESFMWTIRRPGENICQMILEKDPTTSVENLCAAWRQVVWAMPILRTRFVQDKLGLIQVITNHEIQWIHATGLDKYIEHDRGLSMRMGEPLARFALVSDEAGQKRLVWTIHHVIYDGWSIPLVLDAVQKAFRGETFRQGPPFQSFVRHIREQDQDEVSRYWRDSLADCQFRGFPVVPPTCRGPPRYQDIKRSFPAPKQTPEGITMATLLRSAWGIVSARAIQSDDVVFGATVSGRSTSLADLDELAAPTVARVPVRMRIDAQQSVWDHLRATQQQAADMVPFEQAGSSRIAEIARGDKNAPLYQTKLLIQPVASEERDRLIMDWKAPVQEDKWFCNDLLNIEIQIGDLLSLKASWDTGAIEADVVARALTQLEFVLGQISTADQRMTLGDLDDMLTGHE